MKLYDPSPVEIKDLGSQFYLCEDDVGKPTAACCKAKLQELNTAVNVSVLDNLSDAELLPVQVSPVPTRSVLSFHPSQFSNWHPCAHMQAVVCTTVGLEEATQFDARCRAQSPPVPFIYSQTCGVFGQVFCDFGADFTIFDVDGAPQPLP